MEHKHRANGFMVVGCERRQKPNKSRGEKREKEEKDRGDYSRTGQFCFAGDLFP